MGNSKSAYNNTLSILLSDVRKVEVIDREEERLLIKKYKEEGCMESRDKLITANIKFVVKAGLEYKRTGNDLLDLWSEGFCGLIHALDKFEPEKDIKFISYAVWWIKDHITKYISNNQLISIPTGRVKTLFSHLKEGGIDLDELATLHPELQDTINAISQAETMDSRPYEDSDMKLCEIIADTDAICPEENSLKNIYNKQILDVIDSLNDNLTQDIIKRYYGITPYVSSSTLREISECLGLSHERIRQLKGIGEKRLALSKTMSDIHIKYDNIGKRNI